jgi:hypothetical protein
MTAARRWQSVKSHELGDVVGGKSDDSFRRPIEVELRCPRSPDEVVNSIPALETESRLAANVDQLHPEINAVERVGEELVQVLCVLVRVERS